MSATSYRTRTTAAQQKILDSELSYDDGGRYALVAVSGYSIGERDHEPFGTVFSIIDTTSGDEYECSPLVGSKEVREERRHYIARVRHLNGRDDPYAA